MKKETNMLPLLEEFHALLVKEKEALIKNNGEEIQQIVKEKETFVVALEKAYVPEEQVNLLVPLLEEIRQLQETNLLLTQQSLEFVGQFIESIQKEAQKQSKTYSKKGGYQKTQETAFLDQSL